MRLPALIGSRIAIASSRPPLLLGHQRQPPHGQHVGGVALEHLPQPALRLVVATREVVEQSAVRLERERERIQLHRPAELRDRLVEPAARREEAAVGEVRVGVVGPQLEGAPELPLRGAPVPLVVGPDVGVGRVRFRQRLVEIERLSQRRPGLRQHLRRGDVGEERKRRVVVGQADVGRRPVGGDAGVACSNMRLRLLRSRRAPGGSGRAGTRRTPAGPPPGARASRLRSAPSSSAPIEPVMATVISRCRSGSSPRRPW